MSGTTSHAGFSHPDRATEGSHITRPTGFVSSSNDETDHVHDSASNGSSLDELTGDVVSDPSGLDAEQSRRPLPRENGRSPTTDATADISGGRATRPHLDGDEANSSSAVPLVTPFAKHLGRNRACAACRERKLKCDGVRPICGQCGRAWAARRKSMLAKGHSENDIDAMETPCSYIAVEPRTGNKKSTVSGSPGNHNNKSNARKRHATDSGTVGGNGGPSLSEENRKLSREVAELRALLQSQRVQSTSSADELSIAEILANTMRGGESSYQTMPSGLSGRPTNHRPSANPLADQGQNNSTQGVGSSTGSSGIQQDPDPMLELVFSGWPTDFPPPQTVDLLVNIFFENFPFLHIFHPGRFLNALMLGPHSPRYPHPSALHAMFALSYTLRPDLDPVAQSRRANPQPLAGSHGAQKSIYDIHRSRGGSADYHTARFRKTGWKKRNVVELCSLFWQQIEALQQPRCHHDAVILLIKGFMMVGRCGALLARLPRIATVEDLLTSEFDTLSNSVGAFAMSFPPNLSSYLSTKPDGQLDAVLITAHALPHCATLLLHDPMALCRSESFAICRAACSAVLAILRMLAATGTNLALFPPLFSFIVTVTGRNILRRMQHNQRICAQSGGAGKKALDGSNTGEVRSPSDGESDRHAFPLDLDAKQEKQVAKSEIDMVVRTLCKYGQTWPVGIRQAQALTRQMGVPLDIDQLIYEQEAPSSHQSHFQQPPNMHLHQHSHHSPGVTQQQHFKPPEFAQNSFLSQPQHGSRMH
ncbi:hypothetical protein CBOM_00957 [Ceraceosorus bombacis]|uniref:Zn(2)-C6 fungal-type domain-containing protein n=1 Tax=Ceraceosorus bombacis TaxID=401625 RepID=A0A0N7L976_9BASI|nr:hypothetical protein CBOM_00957 [Ceraceosorus bombacis]